MEAIQRTLETNPTSYLMDISMPGMDGLEATRQLKKMCPASQVLALTVHDDKHYFMEMLAAGASGYLTKQAAADELVAAIHAIAEGNVYLQPALARWLLEDYQWLSSRRSTAASSSRRGAAGGANQPGGAECTTNARYSNWLRRVTATMDIGQTPGPQSQDHCPAPRANHEKAQLCTRAQNW